MTLIDDGESVLVCCSSYDHDHRECTYVTINAWSGIKNKPGCYKIDNRECINGVIKLDWVQYILQGKNWERDWTSEEETEY